MSECGRCACYKPLHYVVVWLRKFPSLPPMCWGTQGKKAITLASATLEIARNQIRFIPIQCLELPDDGLHYHYRSPPKITRPGAVASWCPPWLLIQIATIICGFFSSPSMPLPMVPFVRSVVNGAVRITSRAGSFSDAGMLPPCTRLDPLEPGPNFTLIERSCR